MGLEKINILEQVASLEVLSEELAKLQRTMRYLLNGNLDFQNIRAKGIQAENIDVDKLSAIVADIGEVTAGIIRGVEIYGSYIATSEGGFPRTEMSTKDNYFKVWLNATTYLEIIDQGQEGLPQIIFTRGSQVFRMGHGIVSDGSSSSPGLYSNSPFAMLAIGGLFLVGDVNFTGWGSIINNSNGRTLQQELNNINNRLDALES